MTTSISPEAREAARYLKYSDDGSYLETVEERIQRAINKATVSRNDEIARLKAANAAMEVALDRIARNSKSAFNQWNKYPHLQYTTSGHILATQHIAEAALSQSGDAILSAVAKAHKALKPFATDGTIHVTHNGYDSRTIPDDALSALAPFVK